MADRKPALLALAIPVLTGLIYQAGFGAPEAYPLITAAALAIGLGWIALAPSLPTGRWASYCIALLQLGFALPLLTGPEINDVQRWLPLGPVSLHAGMLTLPLLLRLAARQQEDAPALLAIGLFIALLQPDAASAAAITLAAVGLYHARPDWKLGALAAGGLFVIIVATLRGELAPQPFVERLLMEAGRASPAMGVALFAALVASFVLILTLVRVPPAERYVLAGALFGFAAMAMINTYPMPLIGFGAAPILGFALALAPASRRVGSGGEKR